MGAAALLGRSGWAANGRALYWTENVGADWRAITPPDLVGDDPVARISDLAFVRPGHIWVAAAAHVASAAGDSSRAIVVERSSDKGRTWQRAQLPGCTACGAGFLSFRTMSSGYALAGSGESGRIYTTTDGGATWQTVGSTTFDGPVVFSSDRRGWAVSEPRRWTGPSSAVPVGGGVLYGTTDGGRSWRPASLPFDAADRRLSRTAGIPRFFGANDGVVPAFVDNRSKRTQKVVVFVTRDSGRTWARLSTPASAKAGTFQSQVPQSLPFSAAAAGAWFLAVGAKLEVTRNGGRLWSAVTLRLPLAGARITGISFASRTAGWAILANAKVGQRLARTTDGGKSWTLLSPG